MSCAKTAEPIEMPFEGQTRPEPKKPRIILDRGGPDLLAGRGTIEEGAYVPDTS